MIVWLINCFLLGVAVAILLINHLEQQGALQVAIKRVTVDVPGRHERVVAIQVGRAWS